ncbi:S28 family serine protease [Haliangium ochraceum]|uniref:Peptidase S37 tripeptidyl aminopeptidase n=1 Tax=Haliangium ochraceum (strain DSM 14365 / JCM 11303 / SMP-2) TaxID=502025 RepID=D0LRN3_HALO1|nr:S28 family serine protease [Haliangium ochraceum]ACY19025.1 peptidase S37 tripeptidyl aminopeptidase [Haliangium ochraceum DSM 14365]
MLARAPWSSSQCAPRRDRSAVRRPCARVAHAAAHACLLACLAASVLACTGPESGDDERDIAELLAEVPGFVAVEELPARPGSYGRAFAIVLEQPVDHAAAEGARFQQHITLAHVDRDAPMVLASTGYHNYLGTTPSEPTYLLNANQVAVEHRYFGDSRPEPTDWSYLTVEQAAADHHRVVELLRPIYSGDWVSTGLSKGGVTSLLHRRYYPDDVTATVAYVAPVSFSVFDERYRTFFDDLDEQLAEISDGPACKQRVRDLQRELLLHRDEVEDFFAEQAALVESSFERVGGLQRVLEVAIVEMEFSYWQYFGLDSCSGTPGASAPLESMAGFLALVNDPLGMADGSTALFEPYYYQVLTELGYPLVPLAHIEDLLIYDYAESLHYFLPEEVEMQQPAPPFDPAPMRELFDWVRDQGERVIVVYGGQDPWTGGAFELAGDDTAFVVLPRENHGAQLLNSNDRSAVQLLQSWVPPFQANTGANRDAGVAPAVRSLGTELPRPRPRLGW